MLLLLLSQQGENMKKKENAVRGTISELFKMVETHNKIATLVNQPTVKILFEDLTEFGIETNTWMIWENKKDMRDYFSKYGGHYLSKDIKDMFRDDIEKITIGKRKQIDVISNKGTSKLKYKVSFIKDDLDTYVILRKDNYDINELICSLNIMPLKSNPYVNCKII